MVGGGVVEVKPGFEPEYYIERALRNSECRVGIVVAMCDGDPYPSIGCLAKSQGLALWTVETVNAKSEQNALDYLDVGIQKGDWLAISGVEHCSLDTFRKIAKILYSLQPEPAKCPNRELFRLWLVAENHVNLGDTVHPVFPQLLAQHCMVAYREGTSPVRNRLATAALVSPYRSQTNGAGALSSSSTTAAGPSSSAAGEKSLLTVSPFHSGGGLNFVGGVEKWVKRFPGDPLLMTEAGVKHESRRAQGRDSDSESDTEIPGEKIHGRWFYHAVEMYQSNGNNPVMLAEKEIFHRIDKDDYEGVSEMCKSSEIDLDHLRRDGMTVLQYAVSNQRREGARALLEAGADSNVPRESDSRPCLFMCLDDEDLVQLLLDFGANMDQRYQGCYLEQHPDTAPNVMMYIKALKGYSGYDHMYDSIQVKIKDKEKVRQQKTRTAAASAATQ